MCEARPRQESDYSKVAELRWVNELQLGIKMTARLIRFRKPFYFLAPETMALKRTQKKGETFSQTRFNIADFSHDLKISDK